MDKTIQHYGLSKQLLILKPFIKQPWKTFTLTEIKNLANNRSHHYVYEALENFQKLDIITIEKKGNTNLYKINPNAKDTTYLAIAEFMNKPHLPKAIEKVRSKIKNPYYTLLITGSYAENKQTPESDLDMVIIIPHKNKKPYQIALKEGELTIPEIHGFVFTTEEFYQMLINNEFNLGKECARKHIIIQGAEPYYKILFKALQNGFQNRIVPAQGKNRTRRSNNTSKNISK